MFLSVGGTGRVPRRYRGKDIFYWLYQSGFMRRPAEDLPSPRAKFAANPHVSGKDGGHTLNLHQFVRDGVNLMGHLRGREGDHIALAADLRACLAKADEGEAQLVRRVDAYIAEAGIEAPQETLPQRREGYAVSEIAELDLLAAGVGTVVWATGFGFGFGLVRAPDLDADGYPVQRRGVTPQPGLYFAGLPWLEGQQSGLWVGVGAQAEHVARTIAAPDARATAVDTRRP